MNSAGDGNAGFVRSTIVEALCEVLHHAPKWREAGEQLLRAMELSLACPCMPSFSASLGAPLLHEIAFLLE